MNNRRASKKISEDIDVVVGGKKGKEKVSRGNRWSASLDEVKENSVTFVFHLLSREDGRTFPTFLFFCLSL